MFDILELRLYEHPDKSVRSRVASFLHEEDLDYEGEPELTVCLEDEQGHIRATASLDGKVIKMVAVDSSAQQGGYSSKVISAVITHGRLQGKTSFLVFTKASAADRFISLGFQELARYEPVVLLEMGEPGIRSYRHFLGEHKAELPEGSLGGEVVINGNPFTKGHRFLLEEARSRCDHLYVIVVEADLSLFPFQDRMDLIRQGTRDIPGVTVLPSRDYAVSQATFPSYFLRGQDALKKAEIQTCLDVTLFANLYGKELHLARRFVGTEPYCAVTNQYNSAMKTILPSRGIEVVEIPRKESKGVPVSASLVREYIREDRWEEVKEIVPPVTWDYLTSPEQAPLMEKIRNSSSRH